MSTGFVLNIPDTMLEKLKETDKHISSLATKSKNTEAQVISAFRHMADNGVGYFLQQMRKANELIDKVGTKGKNMNVGAGMFADVAVQAKNAIDEVNRVVTAISKVKRASGETGMAKNPFAGMSESLKDWNALQSKIDEADQKIKKLTSTTMDYERQMQRMRSGQTTPINISYNEYAYTKERIAALQEEKRVLQEKQAEITRQNNALSEQVRIQESLKRFVANQNSLPEQRKRQEYEAMRQMYIEDEKASEAAEKKKVKDAEKAEKERQKLREKRIREEEKAAERERKAYERMYKQLPATINTKQAGQLVARSMDATSINQRLVAIKNLQAAINNLDSTDKRYDQTVRKLNSEINRQKEELKKLGVEIDKVGKQHRGLLDISGQLARRLALVFSVSQITGYVKKLIEVRGEFELQQRSLQAILQNKDEANRIWQQTVDLAVRSPFRVKELVSYTKQLAAYRIESDKLFETNKMLADISAGLGVDMQRLILAFGQVRSAAYLRGTELRQFTEAGIPILEQLAQYFTELEGRAVSVGDVFERVSKRMVSFADVEEIFRRMTSEGGTFYRMQEIQAETLKGMWSNLKDSVDIMVNEIGKGNESTLKNSLALVKQLVDNWRSVKAVIETAGISLMAYFGVDVLRKIGRGIKALYATISAHPLLAIVSVLGLIATAIWRVREAQNALTAAMSEVDNEILGSLEEGIGLYRKLAEAVNDATKSSEERNKALDNLKSRFQDILPDQYLELEYIKQIGDNYKDAEKAMTDYYDAKAQAQKKDRIEGLYTKELDTDTSELISATRDVVSKLGEKGIISGEMQTAMLSGISGIVNKVVEDVKAGKIDANIEKIQGAIFSKLEDYAGYEGYLYGKISESPSLGLLNFGEQVSDVTDTLREYLSALEDIQGLPYETYGQKVAGEWLNKEKESLRQISEIYKKLLSLYSKYSKATDEDKVDIADDISLAMSQVPENLNAYLPLLQESVDKMKAIAEKGAFEFTASMQTLESDFIEGLAGIAQYAEGEIGDVNGDKIAQTLSGNLQEGIKTASDKLDMTPFQNAVVGGARQIAEKFGQDVNIFEKFIPNQKESLSNIRQEVKSQIESYESQILEMQTSLTQDMYELSEEVLNNTKETIRSMTEQLPALKAFLAFLGKMEKDKGGKDDKAVKILQRRINLLKEVNKKYLELEKTFGSQTAEKKIIEAYSDTFKEAFEGTGVTLDLYKVMTQSVVDARKIGREAGSALTGEMLEKLKELEGAGTYIRSFSDDLIEEIKKAEGFRAKAYQDAGGVWTQGYGETQGVEKGKEWTEEFAAQRLRTRLTEDYASAVNKVLDANRDLIITQEQYNALVDLAYQGGGRAVKNLVKYAKDVEQGASYIERISKKIEATMGEEAAARFGETFVNSFKEAETIQERMAMLLQTMNLTIKGKINKDWYEGMQKRSDKRAAMFSGDLDIANQLETVLVRIAGMDFKTTEGMVEALNQLKVIAEKDGPEAQKILSQVISGFEAEIGLRIKKEADEKLKDDIQELFDRYDLSLELKKLNIPPDLAKSLFDVDYLDLEGLKKAVEDQKDAFVGKDMLDEYDDLMKKIGELSRKRQEEEAKEFINFLKKNLDEVKLIQDKGAYNIALADRLFGEGKITAEQYMSSIRQIVEDTNKEASRVNLEMFKDSPKYIQAMGDLTAYTTKEIRELIKSLEDVVAANSDAFSADEAKAYIDAIYNAQEKLDEVERSPFRWETFANIGEILKTNKDINDQKEERDRLQEQEKAQLEELVRLEEKLKRLQDEKNAILSGEGDLKSKADRLAPVQSDIDATTQAIKTGQKAVSATQSQAKTTETILGKLGDKMKGLVGKGGSAATTLAIIDAIINGINDTVQGVLDITNEIGSVMESFGKETDMSTGFGKFQKGFAVFAESSQHAADGWNALKNGDPVGAVVSVVKSVTSLIRGINEYKDAKLQVEIDKQVKEVERLGKAYEKLEAATESAYSIHHLQQYNEELERNVELQIASYKAMIAAEQAKKNTDDEQIAAWNEEIEALTQQWEELKQSLIEGVGGVSDYRSQTREFVDSWVSAFQETGDGLSGLKENFREFFDNIIAEQAALRVTEKFLEPFYESLNMALKDYELTAKESKDLREMVEKIAPDLSSALEKIWGELGGSRGESGGAGLSALQKGIQGITESTAQVLEALLNSMRFYVADSNSKLGLLLQSMGVSTIENPQLVELRTQTMVLNEINAKIASLNETVGGLIVNDRLKVTATTQLDQLIRPRANGGVGLNIVND